MQEINCRSDQFGTNANKDGNSNQYVNRVWRKINSKAHTFIAFGVTQFGRQRTQTSLIRPEAEPRTGTVVFLRRVVSPTKRFNLAADFSPLFNKSQ